MLYFIYFILYLYVFIIGICLASFINVVIYRVPKDISVAKGRSFCPNCKHQLKFYDLFPIFSWLFLKGRCRYCKEKISPRYAIVETLGGAIAVLSVVIYDFSFLALIVFITSIILVAITFIDLDNMIIPNSLIIVLIIPAVISIFVMPDVSIVSHIIGFFCISVPMLLLTLVIDGAFGGGDIKLVAVCGFMLGWYYVLPAIFIAILLAGIYAIYLLITKKADKKSHFAFGPFLSFGIIVALYWGELIIKYYLNFTSNLLI